MKREYFILHTKARVQEFANEIKARLKLEFTPEFEIDDEGAKHRGEKLIEKLVEITFVSEEAIYPFVDLMAEKWVDARTLLLEVQRSGYAPCAFGKNWTGADGPYLLCYNEDLKPQG